MTDMSKIPESIDDKLYKVKYVSDEISHLNPNSYKCSECKSRICTIICPAKVYEWDIENDCLIVNHENCLECGACRIACEKKSIEWAYPKSGKGVVFKYG